jgi:hypothetical protein
MLSVRASDKMERRRNEVSASGGESVCTGYKRKGMARMAANVETRNYQLKDSRGQETSRNVLRSETWPENYRWGKTDLGQQMREKV